MRRVILPAVIALLCSALFGQRAPRNHCTFAGAWDSSRPSGGGSASRASELYLLSTTKWLMLYPKAAPMKMSEGKCARSGSRDSERNVAVP